MRGSGGAGGSGGSGGGSVGGVVGAFGGEAQTEARGSSFPFKSECSQMLEAMVQEVPKTTIIYCHKPFSCFFGRDLNFWVARGTRQTHVTVSTVANNVAHTGAIKTGNSMYNLFEDENPETPTSRASKFLESIFGFFQYCMDHGLISGVNVEERHFLADSFYVINKEVVSKEEISSRRMSLLDDSIPKAHLDIVDYLKSHLEIKDRRVGMRSYPQSFLLSEARMEMEKKGVGDATGLLDKLIEQGLIACAGSAELYCFVARVHHVGFVYVATNPTNLVWTKRWMVLREDSVLFFHENRKQLISEMPLAFSWAKVEDFNVLHEHTAYHWSLTSPSERVFVMSHSLVERNMWLDLIVPLNTVVGEENEILQQAEAIITSTAFWINNI